MPRVTKPDVRTLRNAIDAMREAAREQADKRDNTSDMQECAWADIYHDDLTEVAAWLETVADAEEKAHNPDARLPSDFMVRPRNAAELQELISTRFSDVMRDVGQVGVCCIVIGATTNTSDRALLSSTTIESTAHMLESAATTYRDASGVRLKSVGQA